MAENSTIKEGSAEIISGGNVFYNPVQEFNRDLSISVLNVYFEKLFNESSKKVQNPQAGVKCEDGLRILEALAATGLRSIRYAKEIAGIKEIVANDLSRNAVKSIEENVKYNNVESLISPSHKDAMTLMYTSTAPENQFDVIDLDPYGCPNRFLDGAIQSIRDGGLLLVTATDMAVLAGNTPEACFAKYGTVPLRNKACHEMALRILLRTIEEHANRYGRYIEPLLSVSVDFYIRIFVRVFTGQNQCKYSMSKQSTVYQCTGCDTLTLQPLGILKPNPTEKNPKQVKFSIPTGPPVNMKCDHCNHKHHVGGPIWSAAIHNKLFVNHLLEHIKQNPKGTSKRLIGMLTVVSEELEDVPLYYAIDKLCCVVKLEIIPSLKFRSALLHAGYRVSYSHACKNSVKTNAPPSVLWDILRSWNKLFPVKAERMLEGSPVKNILSVDPKQIYNLVDIHPDANPESRRTALSRFPENPTPHWGPGTRATIMIGEDKISKSIKNQNKHKKAKEAGDSPDAKVLKVDFNNK